MNDEVSPQEESMRPPKVGAREESKSHADELTVAHTDSSAAQRSHGIEGSASSHSSSSTPVTQFGDYEIVSEIARGGMGVVYKARQIRLNRIVALKMILGGQLASDDDVKRFYLEAESAASLDHPGIVPIYEIGNHDGQHFFSMGFVEGTSLANLLKEGPMAPREAAECLARICDAIQFAHDRGVIHRDLKPGNILLSTESAKGDSSTLKGRSLSQSLTLKSGSLREGEPSYQPKVTDFGLAKQTKGGSELTGTGQILGTPSYMPPEQADGKLATVGPLADVYSLGAILYCMLTGRPPFQSSNPIDTLMQVLKSQPIAPRQLNPAIPRDLETICLKAIEKQPSKRYASAAELREELLRFMTGEPILARPISSIERGWRWLKRHPSAGTFAGVVLGSLGIITGVTISSNRKLQKERDVANHATIEANEQRNAAQRRLDKAIEAVDKLLVRVASEQWAARPELQSEKKYLLEQAVGFYLSFIEESRGDTKVRLEAAKAQMRLGNVYLMLNDFDASLQSVNAAQRLFKDLMSEQPQEASIRNLCSEATILKANTLALTARYQESNDEYLASIRQADEALQLAPENIEYKIRKLESQSSYGYFLLSFDPKKGKETIAQLMQNADEIEGNGARYEARLAIGFALTVDAAYKLVDSNMPAAAQSYGKAAQLLETLRDQTPPSPGTLSSFTIPTRSSRFSVGSCRVSAIGTNRPNGKGWHACSRGFRCSIACW